MFNNKFYLTQRFNICLNIFLKLCLNIFVKEKLIDRKNCIEEGNCEGNGFVIHMYKACHRNR